MPITRQTERLIAHALEAARAAAARQTEADAEARERFDRHARAAIDAIHDMAEPVQLRFPEREAA